MQVFHHSTFAMGTRFNLVLPLVDNAYGESLGWEVNALLEGLEAKLSCHRSNSELAMVNHLAPHGWVTVSDELAIALDACHWFWKETAGAFDPGLYRMTQLGREMPGAAEKTRAGQKLIGGWKQVEWDSTKRRIRFEGADAGIDLGGFGKGYALEHIIKMLKGMGITSAFISFGESSMATIGSHPLSQSWEVAIQHPGSEARTMLELNDDSVSVSGLKRFEVNDGEQFQAHILAPSTALFVTDARMVVVQSKSPLRAEVLSTAIAAAGNKQLEQIVRTFAGEKMLICPDGASEFICLKQAILKNN